ncbi:hypothetical protein GGR53DRAFT_471421 [Hypoxylon sp. FL1150]|nr:hypothetical protein GGR53DRAFT_471421 [Hypoxylon sp. FL1150]
MEMELDLPVLMGLRKSSPATDADAAAKATSAIRDPGQVAHLERLGADLGGTGKLNVWVCNIEDVRSESQAEAVIDEFQRDYVVWSAGAAGKGAPERVEIIDRATLSTQPSRP